MALMGGGRHLSQLWENFSEYTDYPSCQEWTSQFGCLDDWNYCDPSFGLSFAGYTFCYVGTAENLLIATPAHMASWLHEKGSKTEKNVMVAVQWLAFSIAILLLSYYCWSAFKATVGWEEVYVCMVELAFVSIEIFHEFDSPATVYLSTGNHAYVLRYAEWLLSCPVILIHLSNLSGMKNDYSKRTMRLLVSCIGMIVFGMYAGLSIGYLKWILYFIGCLYSCLMWVQAAKCYVESYATVPKGLCRLIVKMMAISFFASWGSYPIFFAIGPEGLQMISKYGNAIAHTILDIIAKEFWTFNGHLLRIKIHEHIIIHGDIRKKTTLEIAGDEVEVEEFVDEEDEEGIKQPTAALANRQSFVIMRDRLKARGFDVRVSLGMDNVYMQPGRIILAVTDFFIASMFQMQFQQLPRVTFGQIELVPAIGEETAIHLTQQAQLTGGCDFVLIHPEFLRNTGPTGLLARLRAMGARVCAFGPATGPMKDLIDASGIDAVIEGPPLDPHQLERVISSMQMEKNMAVGMLPLIPPMTTQNSASIGGANPAFVGSPMGSRMGGMPGMAQQSQGGASGGGPASEAEMVQNLFAEINRLKSELQS